VTLSKKDQDRYDRMAAAEEHSGGESLPGEIARGAGAAALGQQMLLEALGSEEAVARAVGRPHIDGRGPDGSHSPTIHVRVAEDRRARLERLRGLQHRRYTSDLVRDAIDEYLERHEHIELHV
jgi:hypothetical protein